MQAGLSTKNAPSPSVVLPHYTYGAVAFIIAAIALFFAADELSYSAMGLKIYSLVHIMVLGWVSMVIFGALYQLIPVVMEVKLYSEKMAMTSFILLGLGTPLMAYSFWTSFIAGTGIMMAGGTFVVVAVLVFALNTILSASKSEVKTTENKFIITSVFWLVLTVLLGFMVIAYPQYLPPNVKALHIHLGIIGWFMMLIVGVASVLMPMFFISHQLNRAYLKAAYWVLNGGLVILLLSFFLEMDPLVTALASLSIFAGFGLFIKYNYDAYKKRLRRKLDIGMKHSVLAFSLLFITMVSGLLSAFGELLGLSGEIMVKLNLVYITSLFYGFISSLILGQMYKTLPFIVWLKLYQDKVGKFKTPLPADMHSQKVADAHYYTFVIGFIAIIAGEILSMAILIKVAAVFMLFTALLYGYNTLIILAHKQKLEELVFAKPKPRVKKAVK